jgi:hypothetical protein
MLNNIYTDFKNYLESAFPDIKIDEYRGEFKEKAPANWNPSFPCCLIRLDEFSPAVRSASGDNISYKAKFTLFIAEKNSFGFELIQQITDDLNRTYLALPPDNTPPSLEVEVLPGEYEVEVGSVKFFAGLNSVRVHTIEVNIY